MIIDEVQTGGGGTGYMWSVESFIYLLYFDDDLKALPFIPGHTKHGTCQSLQTMLLLPRRCK